MGGMFHIVEDRPTPKAVYNWRVYLLAAVASMSSCTIGYDSAFIGTTISLTSFKDEFNFDQYSKTELNLISANIVSLYQAGAFFGALFAYIGGHFLGRKRGLLLFSMVFLIGAGIMLDAKGSTGLGVLYGGRVLAGIGVGALSNLCPIYISELAPPAVRGRLVGIYELGWQIGGLVGFWINYGVNETLAPSHKQWLIPFAVQLIPAGLLLVGSIFIRESPRWLASKGRREEAVRNLCWVRNLDASDIYIIEEMAAIDTALEIQNDHNGSAFFLPFRVVAHNKSYQWRLFLGVSMFFWQNGTGINAINYYSPTVFKSIGLTGTNTSLLTTGIFGVVKTTLTFVWILYLVDHVGRRNLLLFGSIGGSICMWVLGAYIKIYNPAKHIHAGDVTLSSGGIAAMFFFYLWTAIYTPCWNGTPWVYNAEMHAFEVRPLAQAAAAASNWFWNFLVSRFTPQMFDKMGYGVYMFFASLMIASFVFVFFFMPETKGVPLESMDRLFELTPYKGANKIVMEELRELELSFRSDLKVGGIEREKLGAGNGTGGHAERISPEQQV